MFIDVLVMILILVLPHLALLRWVFQEHPSHLIGKKYPRTILFTMGFRSSLARWSIDPDDLVILKKYRAGLLLRYILMFILPGFLFLLYVYVKYIYYDPTLEEILELTKDG